MIDFDAQLNAAVQRTFGIPATLTTALAVAPVPISVVWFDGYMAPDDGLPPPPQSTRPHAAVQLSQLPAGFNAENAQGDLLVVPSKGSYLVKSGQPDGLGWANLELQVAP